MTIKSIDKIWRKKGKSMTYNSNKIEWVAPTLQEVNDAFNQISISDAMHLFNCKRTIVFYWKTRLGKDRRSTMPKSAWITLRLYQIGIIDLDGEPTEYF